MSNKQHKYFKAVFNKGARVQEDIPFYEVYTIYAKAFAEMVENDFEIFEIFNEVTGVRCAIIEQRNTHIIANFNGGAVYGENTNNATVDHIKIDYVKLYESRQKQGGR